MRTFITILLFLIFFSGISKERKLWIGYSYGESANNYDGFIFTIAAETREEAIKIFLRDRATYKNYKFKILHTTGTDYNIWEITDSIIHKK